MERVVADFCESYLRKQSQYRFDEGDELRTAALVSTENSSTEETAIWIDNLAYF